MNDQFKRGMTYVRCQVLYQAVLGSLEVEDDDLENDGIHSVLDDEDDSENNHDLDMMDEHGKNVTGHELGVFAHEKFAVEWNMMLVWKFVL